MAINTDKKTATILLSGGLDSAACVAYYTSKNFHVETVFIDYGQNFSSNEKSAATEIASYYQVSIKYISVAGSTFGEGYVPARNATLLFLALMLANIKSDLVCMGIHAGTAYVDCTQDFVSKTQNLIDVYFDGEVLFDAPFLLWTKNQIIDYAKSVGVPFENVFSSNIDVIALND